MFCLFIRYVYLLISLHINDLKDIFNLAEEARASISDYCINICHSKCCTQGYLLLMGEKEIDVICDKRRDEFIEKKFLTPSEMGMGLKFDLEKQGCRHLSKNFKCAIHNELRPRVCCDYPIFKAQDYYIFADSCPAVQQGLLDEYKKKFEKVGLKVV